MSTQLDRKLHWLIIPGLPMFMWGGHLAITMPASTAVFTTSEPLWLWVGATITMALSVTLAWAVSQVFCKDNRHVVGRAVTGTLTAVSQ